jgi:hypothetical protein
MDTLVPLQIFSLEKGFITQVPSVGIFAGTDALVLLQICSLDE